MFASRIAAVCDEMGAVLQRVAFSPNIKDRLDYSCVGCFRHITLSAPHGSLLNAKRPAASHGSMNNLAMGAAVKSNNNSWDYYETIGGGMGGK